MGFFLHIHTYLQAYSIITSLNPMKPLLFLTFFISVGLSAQGPTHKIDSLNVELGKKIHDTVRVQTLMALGSEYYLSSPSTTFKYCNEAKDLSEKINYNDGLLNSYGWLAFLYEQEGKISNALSYYYRALNLSKKIGKKKDQGTILNNIAAIYKDQGKITEALTFHQQSLKIKKEIGDLDGVSASYNNIGLIYASQGKIREALNYYSKSLKIEEDARNNDGISTALGNIAAVYKDQREYEKAKEYYLRAIKINTKAGDKYGIGYSLNGIGGLYELMGNQKLALAYYNKAIQVRTEIDDKAGIANSLRNIGNVYKKVGKIPEAEASFQRSLANFEELGDKLGLATVNNLLGEVMIAKGNSSEAEQYFNKSLLLARELGYPMNISNAAKNLQLLYRQKGLWKQALDLNDLYVQMKDSVQNDKNRSASMRMQFKYEFDNKVREQKIANAKRIAEEQRKHNIQYALIAVGILIFIVLFLLISHTIIATTKMIRFVGVITLLIVFEFFNLLLHPLLEKITDHSTLLMLMGMVCIASLLVPMHHKIEKWATNTLIEKNRKIRLANAKKTIDELENATEDIDPNINPVI